jgi:prephenate dehydrogenase
MVLDIKMYPQATIYGIDTNEIHLQEAIALGVIDAAWKYD